MQKLILVKHPPPPGIQFKLLPDFYLGIRVHYCKACGGSVHFLLLFFEIHIPIIRKPVESYELVDMTPEEEQKTRDYIAKMNKEFPIINK